MSAIQTNASKMIALTGGKAQLPSSETEANPTAINPLDLLKHAAQLHAELFVQTSAIETPALHSGIAFPYQGQTFFYKIKDGKLAVIDEHGYLVIEGEPK